MYWKRTTHSSIVNVNDNIKMSIICSELIDVLRFVQLQKFYKLVLEVLKLLLIKNQNKMNAHGILQISINETKVYVYK